jgi:hypothetical protein
MGQIARRQNFESQGFGLEPMRALWLSRGALKVFWSAQASRPIENIHFGREIPRKSKQKEPCSKAHFATKPRLADNIQMTRLFFEGAAAAEAASLIGRSDDQDSAGLGDDAKFSRTPPFNPLKRNDRRRFTAENGGQWRHPSARIPARSVRETHRRPPTDSEAPDAGYSTEQDRAIIVNNRGMGVLGSAARTRRLEPDADARAGGVYPSGRPARRKLLAMRSC